MAVVDRRRRPRPSTSGAASSSVSSRSSSPASGVYSVSGRLSRDNTTSMLDFDPDHEALASTGQVDGGYGPDRHHHRRREHTSSSIQEHLNLDYAINTSALARAFPEFSEASSSPPPLPPPVEEEEEKEEEDGDLVDEDEEDLSIEVARGSKPFHLRDDTHEFFANVEDARSSVASTPRSGKNDGLPPQPRQVVRSASSGKSAHHPPRNSLRREAQLRRASLAVKEARDADPKPKSTVRREIKPRRAFSDAHAKVSQEYDGSYISDSRPPTISLQPKNTRFLPQRDRISSVVNKAASSKPREDTEERQATLTDVNSRHSFALPDVDELSELVTSSYPDGPNRSKVRNSRFTKPVPADDMAIPDDELNIFDSLHALQSQVSRLRSGKLELETRVTTLERENHHLRQDQTQREEEQRNQTRWDHTERDRKTTKAAIERNRLEAMNLTLQEHLEAANRKASQLEKTTKALTSERDSVVEQLNTSTRDMKDQNDELRKQNEELRVCITQNLELRKQTQELRRQLTGEVDLRKENEELHARVKLLTELLSLGRDSDDSDNESTTSSANGTTSVPEASQKRKNAVPETEATGTNPTGRQESSRAVDPTPQTHAAPSQAEMDRIEQEKAYEELFDISPHRYNEFGEKVYPPKPKRASEQKHSRAESSAAKNPELEQPKRTPKQARKEAKEVSKQAFAEVPRETSKPEVPVAEESSQRSYKVSRKPSNIRRQRSKQIVSNDSTAEITQNSFVSEASEPTVVITRTLSGNRAPGSNAQYTQESFVDDENVTTLTFMDTKELAQIRKELEMELLERKEHKTFGQAPPQEPTVSTHSNSAPKERRQSVTEENPGRPASREHTAQSSAFGRTSSPLRRRRSSREDKTSAFIIPDITVNSSQESKQLPDGAKTKLESISKHHTDNCFVCTRDQADCMHSAVNIHRPVPVSERQRQEAPTERQTDITIRPSQPPAVALATVIKGLEDELSHLKMRLDVYQTSLAQHDVSFGRRQRKHCTKMIKSLLSETDVKADQIYALYDVLEGQKASGMQMTDSEVDVTINSIVGEPHERLPSRIMTAKVDGESDDDELSEDDLSWTMDGVDSTGDYTEATWTQ